MTPGSTKRLVCATCGLVVSASTTGECPRCRRPLTLADPQQMPTSAHLDLTQALRPGAAGALEPPPSPRAAPPTGHGITAVAPRPSPPAGSIAARARPPSSGGMPTASLPRRAPGFIDAGMPSAADAGATRALDGDTPSNMDVLGSADIPMPARMGRYEIRGVLGRGGMGIVYEGFDAGLQRTVAIKMILDSAIAGDDDLERFVREARVSAKLQHPNIVTVYDVGAHDGKPYIVMDFVRGQSLEALLRATRPRPRRVAEICADVAVALQHAHDRGLVHRDVKPHNVLIDVDGRVRLTDFGLARSADTTRQLTLTGQVMGTPAYMSPEQAAGDSELQGPRSDIWMLGAVLYRALVGRPPYEGQTPLVILQKVISQEPAPPRALAPAVHPDLETICLKCLEKRPDDRYPTAAGVADDLRRFLAGETISVRPPTRFERVQKWSRRNRPRVVGWLLAGALATALVVGAVVTRVQMDQERLERSAWVEAEASWKSLSAGIEELGALEPGSERRRRRAERLLGEALEAVQTSWFLASMAPDDAEAATTSRRAWLTLARVAIQAEQWSLAQSALARAATHGEDDADVAEARAELARASSQLARRRAERVEQELARARAGALEGGIDYERALFRIVGLGDAETVAQLVAALEPAVKTLRDARARVYLSAASPTPLEAAAGEAEIEGLAAAVERAAALSPGEEPPEAVAAALARARRRIERRHAKRPGRAVGAPDRSFEAIVAAEQARQLGAPGARLAQLCVQALGHIGIRDAAAIEALGAYLFAEADELRALPAGAALCLIGGPRAEQLVLARGRQLGLDGPFFTQVAPFLRAGAGPQALPEGDPAALVEVGLTRQARGDLPGAIEAFAAAAKLAAEDADVKTRLGRALLANGDLTAASEAFAAAIAVEPDHAAAWVGRSAARQRLGDLAGAVEDATRALEGARDDGDRVLALSARAEAYRRLGALSRALADATRATELGGDAAGPWIARSAIRIASDDPSGALADAERATTLAPRGGAAWAARSRAHLAADDVEAALADAEHAIGLAPELSAAWCSRGEARLARGDASGAAADFARATEADGLDFLAWRGLAQAHRLAGRLDDAVFELDRAIAIDPGNPALHGLRGAVHRQRRDFAAAEADLTRVVELRGDDPLAWVARGAARQAANDAKGALADFDRALEIDPDHLFALKNRAKLLISVAPERAGADVEKIMELAPDDPASWVYLGKLQGAMRDFDASLAALGRAIELHPEHAEAHALRATAHAAKGDFAAAEEDAGRAIALDPSLSQAWIGRAMIRVQSGDKKGAKSDVEQFLRVAPDSAFAPAARQMLESLKAELGD